MDRAELDRLLAGYEPVGWVDEYAALVERTFVPHAIPYRSGVTEFRAMVARFTAAMERDRVARLVAGAAFDRLYPSGRAMVSADGPVDRDDCWHPAWYRLSNPRRH